MPEEPELTPIPANAAMQTGAAADPAPGSTGEGTSQPSPPHKDGPQRIPRWLERAELFLRVLLRLYIGLAVCLAPWFRVFWDQNPLFAHYPTLGAYAANGAVRGIITGLGLLNLWIAFRDAIHHRDG
jgi:hypothetical protein